MQINRKKKVLKQQERQPPKSVPYLSLPLKKKLMGAASQSFFFKNGNSGATPNVYSPYFDC